MTVHVESAFRVVVAATPTLPPIASIVVMATLQLPDYHILLHLAQFALLDHIQKIALVTCHATIAHQALTSHTRAMNTASGAHLAHISHLKVYLNATLVVPGQNPVTTKKNPAPLVHPDPIVEAGKRHVKLAPPWRDSSIF